MSYRGSHLIVPGLYDEDLEDPVKSIEDVDSAGANVSILDLEDGVGSSNKARARTTTIESLDSWIDQTATTVIRINGLDTPECFEDMRAIANAPTLPDAVMVPEVARAEDIRTIAQYIEAHELSLGIVPLVERPSAVLNLHSIATADSRVEALVFGDYDFRRHMGISTREKHPETLVPRYAISMAASAAGVPAIDSVYLHTEDDTGLRLEAKTALSIGFDGKLATNPTQVAPINDVFTPSDAEIRTAMQLIEEFEAAGTDAGLVTVDGMIVDKPVVDEQRSVLARSRELGVDVAAVVGDSN
jgi:citrate lyase beta subunit